MRRYMFVALLIMSFAAQAMPTLRVGDKVLTSGDTAARVQELLGPPVMRVYTHRQNAGLPDDQMAHGEQWQYVQDGSTLIVTFVNGRATDFQTKYN
jgi:hypothetical protein